MAEKVQKAVRLPPDTAEAVEQYADERGISEADALRRVIRDGLRNDELKQRLERVEREVRKPLWKRVF